MALQQMINPFDHPERYAAMKARERLMKARPWKRKNISKALRAKVFAEKGTKCSYCPETDVRGLDHVIAVAAGGLNTFENLVPCCDPCNSSKQHRTDWKGRKP